jgi:hypothetical protein
MEFYTSDDDDDYYLNHEDDDEPVIYSNIPYGNDDDMYDEEGEDVSSLYAHPPEDVKIKEEHKTEEQEEMIPSNEEEEEIPDYKKMVILKTNEWVQDTHNPLWFWYVPALVRPEESDSSSLQTTTTTEFPACWVARTRLATF